MIWGVIAKIANKMADMSPLINSLYSNWIIYLGYLEKQNCTSQDLIILNEVEKLSRLITSPVLLFVKLE